MIIDAYNANPSSMKVALDNFITMPVQPKAIILGDMRELGPTSDELHAEVVEQRVLPLRYHRGYDGGASEAAVKGLSYLDQRLS